jgi:imidazolonepropionase-like amidohydrolase
MEGFETTLSGDMHNSRHFLKNVAIVDVAKGTTLDHMSVLINNEKIETIFDSFSNFPGEAIDLTGLFLCPGLIDGHVHFFLDGGASSRTTFIASNDQTKIELAANNARVAIEAGITTMRDCGFPVPLMFELHDQIVRGRISGPHIVNCGSPLMRPKGHCHFMGKEITTKEETRHIVEYQFKRGASFVKLMASGGGLTAGTNPSEADLPIELMREAAEVAHSNGAQITAHCHATESIRKAIEAGLDMIEHVSFVQSQGQYHYDENLAQVIRDKGIVVSPTVIGALRTAERFREAGQAHNPDDRGAIERLEGRLTNTAHFHRLGMKIVGGSDCGATDTPFNSLVDEIIAYTRAGMSNADALRSATCNNAAYMNMPRVGEVKVGCRADLILLEKNPLENLDALRQPLMVFKSGRIMHRHERSLLHTGLSELR